jgi:hypothetical protein
MSHSKERLNTTCSCRTEGNSCWSYHKVECSNCKRKRLLDEGHRGLNSEALDFERSQEGITLLNPEGKTCSNNLGEPDFRPCTLPATSGIFYNMAVSYYCSQHTAEQNKVERRIKLK